MGKAKLFSLLTLVTILFCSCSDDDKKTLRVVASPTPHSEMLEACVPHLKKQGINLEIITLTDYLLPNQLIDEKEADANFFQHIPFLELQKNEQNLSLEVLGKVHLEPMGIYSLKLKKGADFTGKTVALPLDPSNEQRALKLLEDAGLLTLDPNGAQSLNEITSNPFQLKFMEIDAALLPRIYEDVDLAVIPTNFALQANLNPSQDALFLEDINSPYANILVINPDSSKKQELTQLLNILQSEEMQEFILENYKGAILPAK